MIGTELLKNNNMARKAFFFVSITESGLLLVEERGVWKLPGGKQEGNEDDLDCLFRESGEELGGCRILVRGFYGKFSSVLPSRTELLMHHLYFADVVGEPMARGEITEARRIKVHEMEKYNLSPLTRRIVRSLMEDSHLKP
jgi:8-oxo-dGTP pyrophosphatase MutT (NUDIX family)